MAERRMFTKKITDSDAFTSMPPTAQALYFHLCMSADDDGFSNNVRVAMFNGHASTDDFNTLVSKKFILPFESGVIVIKHWRMHNLIKTDRYHETNFLEEKAQIVLKNNGAYTLDTKWNQNGTQVEPKWNQNGTQMEPEVRLGKDRIGKDRLGEDRIGEVIDEQPSRSIDYQKIVNLYNTICISFPRVEKLSEARKKAIKARLNTFTLDDFENVFKKAQDSNFLKGANSRNWQANFDWLIKDANFVKTLDGNYDNKGAAPKPVNNNDELLKQFVEG